MVFITINYIYFRIFLVLSLYTATGQNEERKYARFNDILSILDKIEHDVTNENVEETYNKMEKHTEPKFKEKTGSKLIKNGINYIGDKKKTGSKSMKTGIKYGESLTKSNTIETRQANKSEKLSTQIISKLNEAKKANLTVSQESNNFPRISVQRKYDAFNNLLSKIDDIENKNRVNEFEINKKLVENEAQYNGDKIIENFDIESETDILLQNSNNFTESNNKGKNVKTKTKVKNNVVGSKRRLISKPVNVQEEEVVDVFTKIMAPNTRKDSILNKESNAIDEDDDIIRDYSTKKDTFLNRPKQKFSKYNKKGSFDNDRDNQKSTLISVNQTFSMPTEDEEELQRLHDALAKSPTDPFDVGNIGYYHKPIFSSHHEENRRQEDAVFLSRKTKVPLHLKNKTEIFEVRIQDKSNSVNGEEMDTSSETFNLKKYENLTKPNKYRRLKISPDVNPLQRKLNNNEKQNTTHYIMEMKTKNTKNNKTYLVPSTLKFKGNNNSIIASSQGNGSDLTLDFGNAKLKLYPQITNISLKAKEHTSSLQNPRQISVLKPKEKYSPFLRPQNISMYRVTTKKSFNNANYHGNASVKFTNNSTEDLPNRVISNTSIAQFQTNMSNFENVSISDFNRTNHANNLDLNKTLDNGPGQMQYINNTIKNSLNVKEWHNNTENITELDTGVVLYRNPINQTTYLLGKENKQNETLQQNKTLENSLLNKSIDPLYSNDSFLNNYFNNQSQPNMTAILNSLVPPYQNGSSPKQHFNNSDVSDNAQIHNRTSPSIKIPHLPKLHFSNYPHINVKTSAVIERTRNKNHKKTTENGESRSKHVTKSLKVSKVNHLKQLGFEESRSKSRQSNKKSRGNDLFWIDNPSILRHNPNPNGYLTWKNVTMVLQDEARKQKEAFIKVMEHDLAGVVTPPKSLSIKSTKNKIRRVATKETTRRVKKVSPKKRHHRRDNEEQDNPYNNINEILSSENNDNISDNEDNNNEVTENSNSVFNENGADNVGKSIAGFGINDYRYGESWFEGQQQKQDAQTNRRITNKSRSNKHVSSRIPKKQSFENILHGFEKDEKLGAIKKKLKKSPSSKRFSDAEKYTDYNESEDLRKDIEEKTDSLLKKICHDADCQNAVVTSAPENDDISTTEDDSQLSNYVKGGDEIVAKVSLGDEKKLENPIPSFSIPKNLDNIESSTSKNVLSNELPVIGDFTKKSKPETENTTMNITEEEKFKSLREKLAKIRAEAENEVSGDRKQIFKDKCDCDSFIKVMKTPGCMDYCKALLIDKTPPQSSSVIITDGDSPSSPGKIYGGDIVASSSSLPKISTSTQVNKITNDVIHTALGHNENVQALTTDPLFQDEKRKVNTAIVTPADVKSLQIDKKIIQDIRNEAAHDPGVDEIFKERLKQFADSITKKNIDEILHEPISKALRSYYNSKLPQSLNRCHENCPGAPDCPLDCPIKPCPVGCPGASNCPTYCPTVDTNVKDHMADILSTLSSNNANLTPLSKSLNDIPSNAITTDINNIDNHPNIGSVLRRLSKHRRLIPKLESHDSAKIDINVLNEILHKSGGIVLSNGNHECLDCDGKECDGNCHDNEVENNEKEEGEVDDDVISKGDFERLLHEEKHGSPSRLYFHKESHDKNDDDDDDGNDVYYDDDDSDEQKMFHDKSDEDKVRFSKSIHHFHRPYPIEQREGGDEDWNDNFSNRTNMCQNGGVFIPTTDIKTRCICTHQFYGEKCQNYNYCYPNPCENGGQCLLTTEAPMYKCACSKAYVGLKCQDLNPCEPSPCNNQGVCSHDGKIATCSCNSRFKGENCEELNRCFPNPCMNSGICVNTDGKFRCECKHGYKGKTCEEESACSNNPCLNGASCYDNGTSFRCQCTKGYVGKTCRDKVCLPNPCKHGGTCLQKENSAFACICPPWSSGDSCQDISPCRMNPCKNNARCIDSASGFRWTLKPMQYFCDCLPPYKGAHCERNACADCDRNAKCDVDRCVCNHGFHGNGKICRKINKTSACLPNPCKNKAKCIAKHDGRFKCQCKKPFLPPLCEGKDICQNKTCNNNGQCFVVGNEAHCKCNKGYSGKSCAYINRCELDDQACMNNGICIADGNDTYTCECPGKWMGKQCQECSCLKSSNESIPSPYCKTSDSYCHCPPGYRFSEMNQRCQHTREYLSLFGEACKSKPCVNGGFCIELDGLHGASYKCSCRKDTYGENCEFKKQCNPNPCENGGACLEKDGKFLGCECPIGYRTTLCKTKEILELPSCHPSPCLHGAVCLPHPSGGYDCICPSRYTGPHCQIDRCRDCDTHAECVEGRCVCKDGYIGTGYECVQKGCNGQCLHFQTCIENKCQCIPGHKKVFDICIPLTLDAESEDDDPLKLNLDKKKKHQTATSKPFRKSSSTISSFFSTTNSYSVTSTSDTLKTTAWPPTDGYSSSFFVTTTLSSRVTTPSTTLPSQAQSTTSTTTIRTTTTKTKKKILKKKSKGAPTNPSPTKPTKARLPQTQNKKPKNSSANMTLPVLEKQGNNSKTVKQGNNSKLVLHSDNINVINSSATNQSFTNSSVQNSSLEANSTYEYNKASANGRHKLAHYTNKNDTSNFNKTKFHNSNQIEIEHLPDFVKKKIEKDQDIDPIKVHVEKQTSDEANIENVLKDNENLDVKSFDNDFKNMTVFNDALPILMESEGTNKNESLENKEKHQNVNKSHDAILMTSNDENEKLEYENDSKVNMIYKFLKSYSNVNVSKILDKVAKDLHLKWNFMNDSHVVDNKNNIEDVYKENEIRGILKHFMRDDKNNDNEVKYPIEYGVRNFANENFNKLKQHSISYGVIEPANKVFRNRKEEIHRKRILSLLKHRLESFEPNLISQSNNFEDKGFDDIIIRPIMKHHRNRNRFDFRYRRLHRPYQFMTGLKQLRHRYHLRHRLKPEIEKRKNFKNTFDYVI